MAANGQEYLQEQTGKAVYSVPKELVEFDSAKKTVSRFGISVCKEIETGKNSPAD